MSAALPLLRALALTLLIEIPLGLLLFFRSRRGAISLFLVNLLTNPLLNCIILLIFRIFPDMTVYYISVAVGEVCVVAGEAWLYRLLLPEIPLRRAIAASLVLNALSYSTGLILNALF